MDVETPAPSYSQSIVSVDKAHGLKVREEMVPSDHCLADAYWDDTRGKDPRGVLFKETWNSIMCSENHMWSKWIEHHVQNRRYGEVGRGQIREGLRRHLKKSGFYLLGNRESLKGLCKGVKLPNFHFWYITLTVPPLSECVTWPSNLPALNCFIPALVECEQQLYTP